MGKFIENVFETETLSLSKQTDGLWLWDSTRKMNLSMRAKTEREAFLHCIEYYQSRVLETEGELKSLRAKFESIVNILAINEDEN